MFSMANDMYECDICEQPERQNEQDEHRGDVWECEHCGKHFCSACFIKALGQTEWDQMLGESDRIFCPDCYGKEQVRDYMIFEEETSQRYPFPKRYDHLSDDEIEKIVDACKGVFDSETIHEAIGSVIGFEDEI